MATEYAEATEVKELAEMLKKQRIGTIFLNRSL